MTVFKKKARQKIERKLFIYKKQETRVPECLELEENTKQEKPVPEYLQWSEAESQFQNLQRKEEVWYSNQEEI